MSKFKVGDRVAAYTAVNRLGRVIGEVVGLQDDVFLSLHVKGLGIRLIHEKQCRRLKPKKQRYATYVECLKADGGKYFSYDYYSSAERAKAHIEECGDCTKVLLMKVIEVIK